MEGLRILILEDIATDAELVERELRRKLPHFVSTRVSNKPSFLKQLADFKPDIILSDYALPNFNGMDALELVKQLTPAIPFIMVTGSLNEETAVECMKAGATDYVLKEHLGRIGTAIQTALEKRHQIEEKHRAEDKLRASESRYRGLVELSPDTIFVHAGGRIVFINPAGAKLLGAGGPEHLIGRSFLEFVPEANRDTVRNRLAVVEGGAHLQKTEQKIQRLNGTILDVEMTAVPVVYHEQAAAQFIIHDITERKRVEEETIRRNKELQTAKEASEEANRAKSEFLARMSHEIRTPLNGVIGLTDIVLESEILGKQREYVELIKTSANSLLQVINDILDFSKIETGKLELEQIPFQIRRALEDTIKTLAIRAQKKGLELVYKVHPEVPESFVGDPGRLNQVLINLIGNSIKFTEHGKILVEIRRQEEKENTGGCTLLFTIADTGIGIPRDKQKNIFEPFAQADSSTTRRFGGTGLGLSICSQLVGLMNGKLTVESEPGMGSTFSFTARLQLAPPETNREVPENFDFSGLSILVIDNNTANRLILQELLSNLGIHLVICETSEAGALELRKSVLDNKPYNAVIIDHQPPQVDGFGLSRQLSQRPEMAQMKTLLLTSNATPEILQKCEENGIHACIKKPIRRVEFLKTLQACLQQPRTEQTASGPMPLEPLRILLAEDSLVNQRVAQGLLEKRGHKVQLAGNGREALQALEKECFDVVLMDVQMPEMDGFAATAAIREKERVTHEHLPIIALTAHALKGDEEQCLAAGMDAYLSKPFSANTLLRIIGRCIGDKKPTPPMNNEPILNLEELMTRVDGNKEFLQEIADLFAAEAPNQIKEIQDAIGAQNAKQLERAAHKLKGSVTNFSAIPAYQSALKLETMGREGRVEGADQLLEKLQNQIAELQTELKKICA